MKMLGEIPLSGLLFVSFCVSFSSQVAPRFGNLPDAGQNVNESLPVSTEIFRVVATDFENDPITYSMTSSPSSGTVYFAIDSTTGAITVKTTLDYENMPTGFTFVVTATAGGETTTENLIVNIINIPENPTIDSDGYGTVIDDGQTANTYLPDPLITVTDSDTGDTKHCTMNCPPEGQGRFTMERDTCLVYFTTDYSTDFGDPSVVVCDVTVTDSTGNISSTTSPLTITIKDKNNFPPQFTQSAYNYDMSYYAPVGTTLAPIGPFIEATDYDLGKYGIVHYSLDMSSLPPPSDYFRIDSSTGALSSIRLLADACNCPGTTLSFSVIATDVGGLSATAPVTVNVDSSTTTANTTPNNLRYLTLFEDPEGVLWFTIALLLGLIVLCAGGFLILKYCCRCARGSYSNLRPDYEPRQERFDDYNRATHKHNRTTQHTPI